MNTFNLNLDLDKTSGIIQWVTLRQGDKNGTQLSATIYDHGTPVTGNYTARFSLRHPGTGDTYYRETATYNNGVATVTVDEQYAATVTGITAGYFELLQGSTVIASTADFGVRILASATDGAVPGEVYDSAIEDALAELDEATGHINQMVVDATEEYLNAHPELTTTVEDNSLTDAKLIQQGGILSRVDRLMYRLDNLLTNTPAEAESVTVTDAAKTPVAGLALYGKSTQDGTPTPSAPVPIQSVEAANLLPTTATTTTINGVTFTRNADGTYTVAGTATATIEFNLIPNGTEVVTLPAGKYSLSGCPDGGSSSTWKMDVRLGTPGTPTTGNYVTDYGSGYTVTRQAEFAINRVRIVVYSGLTIDATFGPMFTASDTPMPYVPYGHVGLWAKRTNDASTYTVTPVPLDGHTLRSLPGGTRDEVTVDERGHVTLTQRVGETTLGEVSSVTAFTSSENLVRFYVVVSGQSATLSMTASGNRGLCNLGAYEPQSGLGNGLPHFYAYDNKVYAVLPPGTVATASDAVTWLNSHQLTIIYKLATPVTYDLGTIGPTALVGPDMTATGIPTAPFALTYERDLNATLARLEAAIATLA